ncbi:MAG: alpha/beta hydrolase [Pseudomonadota bacterium]
MKIRSNNIDIEVEDTHPADTTGRPVVLLIMGLGMQLIAWPPAMVQALVDAGFRVVRFDNRDAGLSQKFAHLGTPNLLWEGLKFRLRMTITPRYSLRDMAADALGVLDALNIDKAHVVGVSMGGMMAQRLALLAPARLSSLTSIMSTSGARGLPEASPAVTRVLLKRPGKGRDAAIDHTVRLLQTIGSPGFPTPQPELREKVAEAAARGFYPPGIVRQMVAIVADTTRAAELKNITAPTLVIHGKADPLVPFPGGEDTARRIPNAALHGIDGMGHDLPPAVVDRILAVLIPHLKATDALQKP